MFLNRESEQTNLYPIFFGYHKSLRAVAVDPDFGNDSRTEPGATQISHPKTENQLGDTSAMLCNVNLCATRKQ